MTTIYTTAELAGIVGGKLRGNGSARITGVADLREATESQASWASRDSYVEAAQTSRAGVILVPAGFADTPMPAILCDKIEPSIAALLGAFTPPTSRPQQGVHPGAIVDASAHIGESPAIGPCVVIESGVRIGARVALHAGAFIGRDSVLGDDCEVWPNAVIRNGCTLGSRVKIHSCAVIGREGFGYYFDGRAHIRIPHAGGVLIEDDVEIGACTCVDRAKFGNTIIGQGSKFDNQVQVAHNCRIGRYNIFAGQTGVSGSFRSGDYCILGARVGAFDNLTIGRNVQVGGLACITKDLPDNMKAAGFPAQDMKTELRDRAAVRRLPELFEKIKELTKRIEHLEASAHNNA